MGTVAYAQDGPFSGFDQSFSFQQRFEYSDNPDLDEDGESEFYGRTLLNFRLGSSTQVSNLTFALDSEIEQGRNDQPAVDFTNYGGLILYNRNVSRSGLNLAARYRESDVNSNRLDRDFEQDSSVINQSAGTRQSYGFTLNGVVRRDMPVSATYSLGYSEINYKGIDDQDFRDNDLLTFSAAITARATPKFTPRLVFEYDDFNTEDSGVSRETVGVGLGAAMRIDDITNADVVLRYDTIDRSGSETGTDDGVTLESRITRQTKTGSMGLRFNSDVTTNEDGRRSDLSFNHNIGLPRGNVLSYNVGITRSDGTGIDPLVGLNYTYAQPTSQISVGLSQSVITGTDNEEVLNTSLRVGYSKEINRFSRLIGSLSFFNRNDLGDENDDGQRVDFSISHSYALTRRWNIVSGYTYRFSDQNSEKSRSSNTIFVGLSTSLP